LRYIKAFVGARSTLIFPQAVERADEPPKIVDHQKLFKQNDLGTKAPISS